ncbi:enoyl-CoA hydratase-related protein [Ottowia thiooxydans]|uniref:Methylglutaconyl-CoA hydratase n=1 Tax=Ottowia thiooxydans TaxID=219182 RepID=A0ABV2QA07_9BURK
MTDNNELIIDRQGPVLRLTINRPHRRNAFTSPLLLAMAQAVRDSAEDDDLRVIVITGAGDKAFSAGADLTPGDTPFKPNAAMLETPLGVLARVVRECRVPVVGRVNGFCLAGGMGLFGLCDLVVATEDATFGMPEVKRGLFPMQILTQLRDLIPPRLMNEMCMTGEPIDARTAMAAGLLNRVVPADQLDATVDALVASLVAASPMAIRRGKYAMRAVEGMTFDQMMAFTETARAPMIQTEDAKEGRAAFNEKRAPRWTNR